MDHELCDCGEGYYDPEKYRSCYQCFQERYSSYLECIFCGRWHSPNYSTCFQCRSSSPERDEAGRNLRLDILIRDNFTCRDCGSSEAPEVDHIKPCAEGGLASPWNLQVLCHDCNWAKGRTWGSGCRWDLTRIKLMHLYFTYGWNLISDEEQQRLVADARAYADEFTWRAHFLDTVEGGFVASDRPVGLLHGLTDDEANAVMEQLLHQQDRRVA